MSKKYNIVVVGGGAAGLVSAYLAAAAKAKVALVCNGPMGGDCLNTGCVPSKAIIRSAKFAAEIRKHRKLGFNSASSSFEFGEMMQRVKDKIKAIEPHDSRERYTSLGVDCYDNKVLSVSDDMVALDSGEVLKTKNVILATGATPSIPPIPGLSKTPYMTSHNLWQLTELPEKLLVIGAGAVGCEMAQSFARLGSEVTLVEKSEYLFAEPSVSECLERSFENDGVKLYKDARIDSIEDQIAVISTHAKKIEAKFTHIFVATGRRPNTSLVDPLTNGLEINLDGSLYVNKYLQANGRNIFACGDMIGAPQLTHAASHEAYYCVVNALGRPLVKQAVDYSVIPSVVFTEPEFAKVGKSQLEISDLGIEFQTFRYNFEQLDRAICDSETQGYVEAYTEANGSKILGAQIVGDSAGELISEWALAMKNGLGIDKILGTVHAYPTLSEANQRVAGAWKRANTSDTLISVAEKLNAWRR